MAIKVPSGAAASLLLAVALLVAGATTGGAARLKDDPCHNSTRSCLDTKTRLICGDLGAGLIPINKLPCPTDAPYCRKGFCGPAPTTTTTTTTTTLPPDPCAGGQQSCLDEHTLRFCVDLGSGLIPIADTPCNENAPLCKDGHCIAAPTTEAPATVPTKAAPTAAPTRRPSPTTRRPTTKRPTTLAPPSACGGEERSCLDDATVLECGDLGDGLVPLKTLACKGATPVCRAGACVAPPTTPPPTTTPAPRGNICGGKLAVCGDCYTVTTCARLGKEIIPVSNATCPADSPYCVAGACKADLPEDSDCAALPAPASTFKCLADGYLPDPSDCRRFHLCVGDKAFDYDCSEAAAGLIYDHARALCVPIGEAQCFAFDCRGRANQYLTYRPDPTLYALCVTEDSDDALLARCPAGQRLVVDPVDPLNVTCQPFCARAGRTADPDDASGSAFYECFSTFQSGGGLVGPFKGSCPPGSAFDAAAQRCRSTGPARPDSRSVVTAATATGTPPTTPRPWWSW